MLILKNIRRNNPETDTPKKIAVKFCGHCSPRMDMMSFMQQLQQSMPDFEFCFYSREPDGDILLLLNACHAECCSQPPFDGPVMIVSPDRVDGWPTERDQLSERVQQGLRDKAAG